MPSSLPLPSPTLPIFAGRMSLMSVLKPASPDPELSRQLSLSAVPYPELNPHSPDDQD